MTQFDDLDGLLVKHVEKVNKLSYIEWIHRESWTRADGYWWRWVRVYKPGHNKLIRCCYRVNDDGTVKRMV